MGFTWVTAFDCRECGTSEKVATVTYDRLGYPVCPACGASTGPTVVAEQVLVQPSD